MTPRRTARAFMRRRLPLFTLAVAGVVAAGGPIPPAAAAPGGVVTLAGAPAAAPGTISTLAGNPLIEGPATTFGQEASGMAVSGQTLYMADSSKDVIHAVDIGTGTESVIAGTSAAG